MHSGLTQDSVAGQACSMNQYDYESR